MSKVIKITYHILHSEGVISNSHFSLMKKMVPLTLPGAKMPQTLRISVAKLLPPRVKVKSYPSRGNAIKYQVMRKTIYLKVGEKFWEPHQRNPQTV